jgi:hypothetical protein
MPTLSGRLFLSSLVLSCFSLNPNPIPADTSSGGLTLAELAYEKNLLCRHLDHWNGLPYGEQFRACGL